MKKSLLLALAIGTFSGSIPAQQAEPPPPAGKASIVIFRAAREPLLSAHNVDYPIAFDEQWISKLPKARYFVFPAWSGLHRIAPAIRSDQMPTYTAEGAPSSILDLDVKAGETYYIKANPGAFKLGPGSMERVGKVAFELMSKEAVQEDLAASQPVDWLKDLQEGTLADVRTLTAQPEEASAACGVVDWNPDIDKTQTSSFKRGTLLRGTLLLRNDSLVLQLKSAEPIGIVIPYADIATAEVKNKVRMRAVVIRRKNGHLDSFTVLQAPGIMIDREQTQVCGERLAGKLRS